MSLRVQDVAPEQQGPDQDGFCLAASDSEWYRNLEHHGSCKLLLEFLTADPTLIHELGPNDMTVLHKGVEHGYVALVRFVLVDMFDDSGHCQCVQCGRHGAGAPALTREHLPRKTCSYGSTAVNMAVVSGSPKMVVLLEWAIKMCSRLNGQSTIKGSSTSLTARSSLLFRDANAIRSSYEQRIKELGQKQTHADESISHMEDDFLVPDVKDDDLSILDARNSEVESKVISVIEGVLGDPGDENNREWVDMVKERVAKDVDFEFVPLAHVFLHFLSSVKCDPSKEDGFYRFREDVMKRTIEACGADGEDGESGAMLKTLFNILDPRGRPFLHVAYGFYVVGFVPMESPFFLILDDQLGDKTSPSIKGMFWNVSDGAGGTIFHLMGIHNKILDRPFDFQVGSHIVNMIRNLPIESPQCKKLDALKRWCFPQLPSGMFGLTPVEFALLLNSQKFLAKIWPPCPPESDGSRGLSASIYEAGPSKSPVDNHPLRLAAALGRTAIIEDMLKHHIKFGSLKDPGLQDWNLKYLPAIHYATAYG